LNLTEEEAGMIAKNMIGVLGNHQPISDRARQTMVRKMKKLGFSENAMCDSFRDIYAEAIVRFRPGSTEIRTLST